MVALPAVKHAKGGGDYVSGYRTFRLSLLHLSHHVYACFSFADFLSLNSRVSFAFLFLSNHARVRLWGFLSHNARARSQVFSARVVVGSTVS